MALAGKGAVAIWHDVVPEGRDEFYAWHGQEHMPERIGVPGFLRGRRFVAVAGAPEFFNLYETASADVTKGADYLARLNAPTPWTSATLKHFRNVARSLCEVAATTGPGLGGLCATFRYDVADAQGAAHRTVMTRALAELVAAPGIAGAHLLVADAAASAVETAEKRARGGPANLVPRWIALVEGWGDEAPFAAACRAFSTSGAFAGALGAPELAIYRLQNQR